MFICSYRNQVLVYYVVTANGFKHGTVIPFYFKVKRTDYFSTD
jgi:hypothetical protein